MRSASATVALGGNINASGSAGIVRNTVNTMTATTSICAAIVVARRAMAAIGLRASRPRRGAIALGAAAEAANGGNRASSGIVRNQADRAVLRGARKLDRRPSRASATIRGPKLAQTLARSADQLQVGRLNGGRPRYRRRRRQG